MPQPANVHVDQPLTNLAVHYRNPAFVADEVAPVMNVKKESDKYYVFKKEELRNIEALRAVGAEAREVHWDLSTATYNADEYALKMLVADRIKNNADKPVMPRMNTVNKLLKWINLGREKRIQAIAQSRAFVTNGGTPAIRWDGTSPVIETNVDTAKKSVRQNAGVMANKILMTSDVKDIVKKDSTVRNLIRYTMPAAKGLLTNGELPPVLWNLKTVLPGCIENTAAEGATNVIADIWNDNVLVWFAEAIPSLDALTLMSTMRVRQNGQSRLVTTWRENARKGEMIEVSQIDAEEVVAETCGYLLTDVKT